MKREETDHSPEIRNRRENIMTTQIKIKTALYAGVCDPALREVVIQTLKDTIELGAIESIGDIVYYANSQGCRDITVGEMFPSG